MKTELALLLVAEGPTMGLDQLAAIMEITPRSLENQHYAQRCPIPLFKIGSKLQAHVSDVAKYIDEQRADAMKLLQQAREAA